MKLFCAHPWLLIQAKQTLWFADGDKVTPPIYRCPICQRTKNEGEDDPKIVIATLEEK